MIGRAGVLTLVLFAAAGGGDRGLHAQTAAGDVTALRDRVDRRFEILPLREGLALRPRNAGRGIRLIEIAAGTIAIDGAPATGAELRQRLGEDADLILQLSYLGDAERRILTGAAGGPLQGAPTVTPDAPRSPSPTVTPPDAPPPPSASSPSALPRPGVPEPPSVDRDRSDPDRREGIGSRSRRSRRGGDDTVRFGRNITVAVDQIVDGDVVAIGGHVTVDGEVRGDVVAVGGGLTLGPRAIIGNNAVVVGGSLIRDPGARIGGDVQEVGIGSIDVGEWGGWISPLRLWGRSMVGSAFALVGTIARVAILCLLAALVILLGRDYVERAGALAEVEPVKAGAVGLLAQLLFLPILIITIVVMVITLIGIPLLILIPFVLLGLLLVGLVGFTAVAYRVGRVVALKLGWSTENPYMTTVGGVVVLLSPALLARIVGLSGFPGFPLTGILVIVGFVIEYLAWTVGFGSMALLRFSRQRPPFSDAAVTLVS
jgi:hypothetical protein